MDNAAHNLSNRILGSGWKVLDKIETPTGGTGSFFSVCYKATRDDEICFLKAFDFAKFFHVSEVSGQKKSIVDVMSDMINAFRYEQALSNHCKNKQVTKVAFVKEAGEEVISGYAIPIVPYLIFDLADGDVRKKLKFQQNIDIAWKLNSLHSVAVGLKQLHYINVSHQDLKPSNILIFNEKSSKIGDIGRSLCLDLNSPFGNSSFTGDWNYAPPEALYRYQIPDWRKRCFATDSYLMGSLIVFYFAGINMNALLRKNLPDNFSWEYWKGSFEEVKEYLNDSFQKAIVEFRSSIKENILKEELSLLVVSLCNPIPERRGHKRNFLQTNNQYNLEQTISHLALLSRKANYKLLN